MNRTDDPGNITPEDRDGVLREHSRNYVQEGLIDLITFPGDQALTQPHPEGFIPDNLDLQNNDSVNSGILIDALLRSQLKP